MANIKPFVLTLALLATALVATQARGEGLTREQVKAELAEAIRTGEYLVGGEANLRLRDISPGMYPAKPPASKKTREDVKAELAEAIRTGDIISGEKGQSSYEQAPHRYPARPTTLGKTRAEVKAELAEAVRLGDAPIHGEDGMTPAQRHPQRYAAVRAEHRAAMLARSAETAVAQ